MKFTNEKIRYLYSSCQGCAYPYLNRRSQCWIKQGKIFIELCACVCVCQIFIYLRNSKQKNYLCAYVLSVYVVECGYYICCE